MLIKKSRVPLKMTRARAVRQSKRRLDREKVQQLQQQVKDGGLAEEEIRECEREVVGLVSSLTSSWETKHGGLMAATVLLPGASPHFAEKMKGEVPLLLDYTGFYLG